MTDLNDRFAAMLEGEPEPPYDLDRVVADGRRALRRRNALSAIAGTAGTAAVTAAVVVPLSASHHHLGSTRPNQITLLAAPTPTPTAPCQVYLEKGSKLRHRPAQWNLKQLMR